jgi:hypothetical protein
MPTPRDVEGKELPIADLQTINPRIAALGIVGVGSVGKTTLKARLLQMPSPDHPTQTQRVTIHVSALLRDPATYLAIVDGAGESAWQQGEIAEHSDILLVLLDHDDIAGPQLNEDRIRSHEQFGRQLRDQLTNHAHWRGPVHVLLNKSDLWERAEKEPKQRLLGFFAREAEKWKTAFGDDVTSAEHSNDSADDIAHLIETIRQQWQSLKVAVR